MGIVNFVQPELQVESATATATKKESITTYNEFRCLRENCSNIGIYRCEVCYDWYSRVSTFCSEDCYYMSEGDHLCDIHIGRRVPCKNYCQDGRCYNCIRALPQLVEDFKVQSKKYNDFMKKRSDLTFGLVGRKPSIMDLSFPRDLRSYF